MMISFALRRPMLVAIIAFLVLLLALPAVAQDLYNPGARLFTAGFKGLSLNDDDFTARLTDSQNPVLTKDRPMIGALGFKVSDNFSLVGSTEYPLEPSLEDSRTLGDISEMRIMLEGYYDFEVPWMKTPAFKPYISAGFGVTREQDMLARRFSQTRSEDTDFVIEAGAGFSYDLDEKTRFTTGYSYSDEQDIGFGNSDMDYDNHEIRFGLTFELP